MVDICSNWIYFSLKGLARYVRAINHSKRDSLIRFIEILDNITDKIAIFFDFHGLKHEQFEKIRIAIVCALKELVQRQMFSELEPLDKIRKSGISADMDKRRECFQPDRQSRLVQSINDVEARLDSIHGSGRVVDSKEICVEENISKIAPDLPMATFKWRKVRIDLVTKGEIRA